jgi:hypothetical protein
MDFNADSFMLFYLILAIVGLAIAVLVHATRPRRHDRRR